MLHSVPIAINRLTKNVLRNHPNSFQIELYRKEWTRKSTGEAYNRPTLGAAGVLDTDDEDEFKINYIGEGYALNAAGFQGVGMHDTNEADVNGGEQRFIIVPEADSGAEGYFEVKSHDLFAILLYGEDLEKEPARIFYEVVGRETTTDIPPYNIRYVCNLAPDLAMTPDGEYLIDVLKREKVGKFADE